MNGSVTLGALFGILWGLASPFTFIYLIIQDAYRFHSFFAWVFLVLADLVLAGIWPIYWLILHWF